MNSITLYGDLTKLEPQGDGTLRVHGVASSGARDGAGEVVAPDALRKALPAYMAFPAVREMHGATAAGATLHAEVDEAGETRIVAHVVDPTAVKKVKAGVYKGLSIGGKVLERDPADPTRITAIRLDEISLVDRPCNPEAVIDLWKAAPQAPARTPTNEEVRAEAERMARAAGKPGRRNDYVAAARAKLTPSHPEPSPSMGEGWVGVGAPSWTQRSREAPPACPDMRPATTPIPNPSPIEGEGSEQAPALTFEKAGLEKVVADLRKRLAEQEAEIARLRAGPLPPRAAASPLAKSVGKGEDGPLSPDGFAEALAALPPAERAHLIMKAALARPIAL